MAYMQLWNNETIKNLSFLDRHSIVNAVEIGSYEGLTSNFVCDELLAVNGNLLCLDPLSTDYTLDTSANDNEIFRNQYDRFIDNTKLNENRITLVRKKSEEILPQLRDNHYSLIFIDGHHAHREVLIDSQEAFRICSIGGYILWDDYLWNPPTYPVKIAVDEFLASITNYRLLLKLNQVLIQKLPEGSATEDGQNRYQELCVEKLFNDDSIYAAFCNLDSRPDRLEKMVTEINRIGFTFRQ